MKWYPERMSEVEIEIPNHYARRVTELLANEGFLQMEDISYLHSEESETSGSNWQLKTNQFANLEKQILDAMRSLGIDVGQIPDSHLKMISEPDEIKPFIDKVEQEIQEKSNDLLSAQQEIDLRNGYIQLLSPLSVLDIPLDRIRNRRYIYSVLGTMPINKIDRLKTSMTNTPFVLLELKKEGDQATVLLIGSRQNKEYLHRAALSAYLVGVDLPDSYRGTPAEIIATLDKEIEALQSQTESNSREIEKIRDSRSRRLQELYWRVRYSRMMSESLMRYGKLKHGYLVAGWLPSDKLEKLSGDLQAISSAIIIDVKESGKDSETKNAPILIEKKGFGQGFQKLVTTYGMPSYNELNPTMLLMLTFPLIFGAMFGDVGHGLVLTIAGLVLMLKKVKKLERLASLGSVVLLCGLSAIVFGFLFGSIFGIEDVLPAIWMHPMHNIMNLLLITAGFGAILLSMANIIALVNDFHQRHWIHFFFNSKGLSGLLLYWGLLGLVIGLLVKGFPVNKSVFIVIVIASIVMIFLSGFLERYFEKKKPYFEGGFLLYFIQSFFELFETLIGYLSNSLSYVRIGAFAVAHAGLTSVFFILANIVDPGKGIGYWLIVAFGNIFVIGFEGMIVSIQTLRLEYYEFFSKFFTGGGRRYKPFRLAKSNSEGAK